MGSRISLILVPFRQFQFGAGLPREGAQGFEYVSISRPMEMLRGGGGVGRGMEGAELGQVSSCLTWRQQRGPRASPGTGRGDGAHQEPLVEVGNAPGARQGRGLV